MMNLIEFKKYVQDKIIEYPELKETINLLYQLCLDKSKSIENSTDNEILLCLDSIDELIKLQS